MLKHLFEKHGEEDFDKIKFRMKILRFHRSPFERQIHESVSIQNNRDHHLLNSKAEFNRCALPRLSLELGESSYKEQREREQEERNKEKELEAKIEELKRRAGKRKKKKPEFFEIEENPHKRRKKEGKSRNSGEEMKKKKTSLEDIRVIFKSLRH